MDKLEETNYKNKIIRDIGSILDINTKEAEAIFEFAQQNINSNIATISNLNAGEEISGFVSSDGLYYINIKISLLALIAYILDISITNGAISFISTVTGINMGGISRISPEQGETCILKEIISSKTDAVDQYLLADHHKECINNNIHCNYRIEGLCCCSPEEVHKILNKLSDKKILKRLNENTFIIR